MRNVAVADEQAGIDELEDLYQLNASESGPEEDEEDEGMEPDVMPEPAKPDVMPEP
jgi:hypothetical protein